MNVVIYFHIYYTTEGMVHEKDKLDQLFQGYQTQEHIRNCK